MKANIHPAWFPQAKVVCACGNTFTTGSTVPEIRVEICSVCHPFYTGQQRFVDTLGQVEKFQKKTKESEVKKVQRQQILESRAQKAKAAHSDKPSLKDLLMQARKQASS
ncbi:50S ribosomal protein L31 [Candidatus Daviesbacteria bacterium]|nr:50S ribosomal protein L31 [Candidatus Daviesbacteria bacterium]